MVLAVEDLVLPDGILAPVEEHVVGAGGLGVHGPEGRDEDGLGRVGERLQLEGPAQVVVVLGGQRARHADHQFAAGQSGGVCNFEEI